MGKLIKNHWARLIILVASAYQVAASISGFFWPKFFFDFLTTNFDSSVRPIPILQIINLLLGLLGLAWEWPLPIFITCSTASRMSPRKGSKSNVGKVERQEHTSSEPSSQKPPLSSPHTDASRIPKWKSLLAMMHRSIEARLIVYPLSSLAALLLYQATNAGLYYIVGMGVYFWGFSEGEVVMGVPWTLPRRGTVKGLNTV